MITPEQIKNLKPGDPLIINGTFADLDDEGDIAINIIYRLNSREIKGSVYGSPSCVSLPSEFVNRQSSIVNKYDPCRPFKAGDVARVVERFGRRDATHTLGALVTVTKDECEFTFVHVKHETGAEGLIPWFYLELITPVKDFVPYSVRHNEAHAAWSIYGPFDLSAVNYFYGERYPYTEESAKAAAEAECARLNAEHRKEHQK